MTSKPNAWHRRKVHSNSTDKTSYNRNINCNDINEHHILHQCFVSLCPYFHSILMRFMRSAVGYQPDVLISTGFGACSTELSRAGNNTYDHHP